MRNRKLVIGIMIVILCTLIILIAIQFTKQINENSSISDTVNTTYTPSTTPEIKVTEKPEIIYEINKFDESYRNSSGFNSKIVVAEDKIFYLIDYMLYCYDINSEEIVFSEEMPYPFLDELGIYLLNGYVYYIQDKTINRINIDTLNVEEFLHVTDVYNQIFDGNSPNDWVGESFSWFLLNNDIIMVDITCDDGHEAVGIWGAAKVSDLNFKRLLTNGDIVLYVDKIIDKDFAFCSINQEETYECNEFLLNKGNLVSNKPIGDSFEFVGDYVFTSRWPYSSNFVHGINYQTGEVIYEHKTNSSFASLHGLNQYIIYYYYDRFQTEEFDAGEGAVIVDLKNGYTYNNEMINTIISGDVTDYRELLHMEFFLNGDTAYAMKREQNLVEASYYNDDGDFYIPEIVDSYYDKALDIGIDKAYNNDAEGVQFYKIEIINGKFHFTLLYKDYD